MLWPYVRLSDDPVIFARRVKKSKGDGSEHRAIVTTGLVPVAHKRDR